MYLDVNFVSRLTPGFYLKVSLYESMKKILQILLIADTIFLFTLWIMWTFNSDSAKKWFDVSNSSTKGMNVLKSHVGGTFLIFVIFVFLYFIQHKDYWAYAAIVATSAVLITRLISVFVDGFSSYGAIALLNEIIIVTILFYLVRTYSNID